MAINSKYARLFTDGQINFNTETDEKSTWSLTATGDLGLVKRPAEAFRKVGAETFCSKLKPLVNADISIANLEIGLTAQDELTGSGVRGDRDMFAEMHKAMPFTFYSLANNHVKDAGDRAFLQTLDFMDDSGIRYIGAGRSLEAAITPRFVDCKGVKVGLLAFAQDEIQLASEDGPGAAPLRSGLVERATKELAAACDVPIIVMHEGFEFSNWPRAGFRTLCRRLVELGAKAVIAHHSHVPQGIEFLDDGIIFYSLGNFIFDMPHFAPYPWACKSFVPRITFSGTKIIGLELQPVVIETEPYVTRPADAAESAEILRHMEKLSHEVTDDTLIRQGNDEFITRILMPEFLGFITRYGNEHNNDFSGLIEKFKHSEPVHKVFFDFLETYRKFEL